MGEVTGKRTTEAFFGRRRGKALRPQQAAALEVVLPRLKLDLSAGAPGDPATLFGAAVEDVRLEIGFGGGEHLLSRAASMPKTGFIGVEPFVNGMAKLVMALGERPLDNLRLHDDDATVLLDWLPQGALAGIDLLYPDPW